MHHESSATEACKVLIFVIIRSLFCISAVVIPFTSGRVISTTAARGGRNYGLNQPGGAVILSRLVRIGSSDTRRGPAPHHDDRQRGGRAAASHPRVCPRAATPADWGPRGSGGGIALLPRHTKGKNIGLLMSGTAL